MIPVSQDALWNGMVTLLQPARGHGYRFNLDPVLLAGFAPKAAHVLDVGAGVGTIGLLLLKSGKAEYVTAIEVQPELAELARQNAEANGLATQVTVLCGDVRALTLPKVDAVLINPPYFRLDEGHASPQQGRDIGRRERFGTLAQLLAASLPALKPQGLFAGIVPAHRALELEHLLVEHGLAAQTHRQVIPRAEQPAQHMLIKAQPGLAATVQQPPLVVHQGNAFSPEVQAWVSGPVG